MRWIWPWRRRQHVDTTAEARGYLQQLEQRDSEIHDLGRQLREARRRNHFSDMVSDAIRRTRETG